MQSKKEVDIFKKTAILTSIVYFSILLVILIPCIVLGIVQKKWTFTYAWLVCLVPCSTFVLVSGFLPIEKVLSMHKKQLIFAWTLFYVIKYAALFTVPIICVIYGSTYFNKWVMLTMTLVTPITVFVMKMVTTYNKKNKNPETQSTNTIKF